MLLATLVLLAINSQIGQADDNPFDPNNFLNGPRMCKTDGGVMEYEYQITGRVLCDGKPMVALIQMWERDKILPDTKMAEGYSETKSGDYSVCGADTNYFFTESEPYIKIISDCSRVQNCHRLWVYEHQKFKCVYPSSGEAAVLGFNQFCQTSAGVVDIDSLTGRVLDSYYIPINTITDC